MLDSVGHAISEGEEQEQEHKRKNRQLVPQEESILGSAEGVGEAVEGSDSRVDLEYPGGDSLSGGSRGRRRRRGVELQAASSSVSGFNVVLETHVHQEDQKKQKSPR